MTTLTSCGDLRHWRASHSLKSSYRIPGWPRPHYQAYTKSLGSALFQRSQLGNPLADHHLPTRQDKGIRSLTQAGRSARQSRVPQEAQTKTPIDVKDPDAPVCVASLRGQATSLTAHCTPRVAAGSPRHCTVRLFTLKEDALA